MARCVKQKLQRLILRMRKKGKLSYAEISRQTGVHPKTVSTVCHRGHVGKGRKKPKPVDNERVSLGIGRCPICGQMVDLPCRASEIASKIASEAAKRPLTPSDEKYKSVPIKYELSPECELRRLRAKAEHMANRFHEPPPAEGDVL